MKNRLIRFTREYFCLLVLVFFALLVLFVSVRVTLFRYSNFEYGKFDLGNMSQMVYNTLHGNFMEVTDYFGTNMPRWGMSHVDPFLVLFVPFYALFPDARVLIVGQLFLIISSSILLYFIGVRVLHSKVASLFISLAFLFYPAIGYLLAWTGFHGVTAVIPFFLASFLVFEEMYAKGFTKKGLILFYILVLITLTGKEEISLIILMYGIFIAFLRKQKKIGVSLFVIGLVWFVVCFFVLIPSAAKYRIEGYNHFAKSVNLDVDPTRDVLKPNYFLSRYEKFGNSYFEIVKTMVLRPDMDVDVFFSGDKKENFTMTFLPLGFLPLLYPPVLILSAPEFLINYLTTQGGIGTAEIYNHRISMIIPILFISVFFAIKFMRDFIRVFFKKDLKFLPWVVSAVVLGFSLYTSNSYQNPILLWFTQSVQRRLALNFSVSAAEKTPKYVIGSAAKINRLETKDRGCFQDVVDLVPANVSVSAPDYLGDHFSTRRVNALFPANFDSADYVIVDVYSRKVLTILGVDISLINSIVGKVVKNSNYKLIYSCSNIFVFQKINGSEENKILPLQEEFEYIEKVNFNISPSLKLVDYTLPTEVKRNESFGTKFVYKKQGDDSLNSYIIFTSFMNEKTGKTYQIANLPSFGIKPPSLWSEDIYFIEENSFVLPQKLEPGSYKVFVGMTNNLKNYNIYLGDISLK